MAKRVFLHIGRSKTGSTAIQRALQENRGVLEARGFLYPGEARNHNSVVVELPFGAGPALLAAEVRAASSDVILSSEGLQNRDPRVVRDWLSDLDVWVIVYLRDQAEAIASGYQQEVKANLETCDFAEFAARVGVFDYLPFLDAWADAFSRERMIVRVYDGRDVVSDFLSVLGIAPDDFTVSPVDPNPSIAGELLEAKRRINAAWEGTAEALRTETYVALRLLANATPAWRGVKAEAAVMSRIRAAHHDCNRALVREWPQARVLAADAPQELHAP